MSVPSLSTLEFNEEGFFAHTRAIERVALSLSQLGKFGDNNSTQDQEAFTLGLPPGIYSPASIEVGSDGNIIGIGAGSSSMGLTPGSFTLTSITVDADGNISSVSSGSIPASGVGAGSYGDPTPLFTVPYFTVGADGRITAAAEYSIPFIGTLSVPVFNNGGNARGTSAVDWQQTRSVATQVASGQGAVIPGGRNNTASGLDSFAANNSSIASSSSAVAFHGGTASGNSSIALGGTSSGARGFARNATAAGADCVAFGESGGVVTTSIDGSACFGFNSVSSSSSTRSLLLNAGTAVNTVTESSVIGGFAATMLGTTDVRYADGFLLSALGNYQFGAGSVAITASFANGSIKQTPVLVGTVFLASSAQSITMSYSQFFGVEVGSGVSDTTGLRSIFSSLSSTKTYTSSAPLIAVSDSVVTQSALSIGVSCLSGTISLGGASTAGGAYSCHGSYTGSAQVLIGLDNGTTTDPATSDRIQLASSTGVWGALRVSGGFGCNTKAPQTSVASGGAVAAGPAGAAYTATEQNMLNQLKTLANNIRTALVNNGIMS